jgi:hypothetical protein
MTMRQMCWRRSSCASVNPNRWRRGGGGPISLGQTPWISKAGTRAEAFPVILIQNTVPAVQDYTLGTFQYQD